MKFIVRDHLKEDAGNEQKRDEADTCRIQTLRAKLPIQA